MVKDVESLGAELEGASFPGQHELLEEPHVKLGAMRNIE
jgi:hypothetical protein